MHLKINLYKRFLGVFKKQRLHLRDHLSYIFMWIQAVITFFFWFNRASILQSLGILLSHFLWVQAPDRKFYVNLLSVIADLDSRIFWEVTPLVSSGPVCSLQTSVLPSQQTAVFSKVVAFLTIVLYSMINPSLQFKESLIWVKIQFFGGGLGGNDIQAVLSKASL